jgi:hypothetical protein
MKEKTGFCFQKVSSCRIDFYNINGKYTWRIYVVSFHRDGKIEPEKWDYIFAIG